MPKSELLRLERDHGGLSPMCEFCDRDLASDAPMLRIGCCEGGGDHAVCMPCILEALGVTSEATKAIEIHDRCE